MDIDRHLLEEALRALGGQPTHDELLAAGRWSRAHDPSEGYRLMLIETLMAFDVEGADGLV